MGQRSSTTSLSTEQPNTATANQTNAGSSVNQSNSNSTSSVQSRNSNSRNNRNIITQSNSTQNVSNMSPRSRFRHEMTRRGYTNSSSDIFLRLFQIPTSSSASSSSNQQNNQNNQSGLSSFRIFNLRNNPNSNQDPNDLDSDLSSDEDESNWNHNLNSLAHSLPFFFGMRDLKCFVCNKMIPADDVEAHIMMCLTKPRLTYNEDVLTDDKGECIICLENLEKGQTIARLPCLCIYHKQCIDEWLSRSQSCPGHPPD